MLRIRAVPRVRNSQWGKAATAENAGAAPAPRLITLCGRIGVVAYHSALWGLRREFESPVRPWALRDGPAEITGKRTGNGKPTYVE